MRYQLKPKDTSLPGLKSSGLKELAQAMLMKQLVLALCRHPHLKQSRCVVIFMC